MIHRYYYRYQYLYPTISYCDIISAFLLIVILIIVISLLSFVIVTYQRSKWQHFDFLALLITKY